MKVKSLICSSLDRLRYADLDSLACDTAPADDASSESQPTAQGADSNTRVLEAVRRSAEDDSDTYVMVCASPADTQTKLLTLGSCQVGTRTEQHAAQHLYSVEVEGILSRIHDRLNQLTVRNRPAH